MRYTITKKSLFRSLCLCVKQNLAKERSEFFDADKTTSPEHRTTNHKMILLTGS